MDELRVQTAAEHAYTVELLTGVVRRNTKPLPLTPRQREIVIALAVHPSGIAAGALGELVHPDRDAGKAANIVNVCIHRVRRRVAMDFIVTHDRAYVLGPAVRVDPHRPEALLTRLAAAPLTAGDVECLRAAACALRAPAPAALRRFDWYCDVALRMQFVGHDLAMALARKALAAGMVREALDVARELTYEDPCDDEAWDFVIRTQLSLGQRSAALHGFRVYEAVVAAQLQSRPSRAISDLLCR